MKKMTNTKKQYHTKPNISLVGIAIMFMIFFKLLSDTATDIICDFRRRRGRLRHLHRRRFCRLRRIQFSSFVCRYG